MVSLRTAGPAGDRERAVALRAHLREAARLVLARHQQHIGAGDELVFECVGEPVSTAMRPGSRAASWRSASA